MDGLPRAVSRSDGQPLRNTPTIFNVAFNSFYNWDGVSATLEAQAALVLLNPKLMNMTWPALLERLGADAGYVSMFEALYSTGLTPANVTDALATFARSLFTPNARFDRYLRGEPDALSASEQRGYTLFKSYGCVACHQGVNIGGNMFQKFGIFAPAGSTGAAAETVDLGRYWITGATRDREVFRVPSLRNVAVTAPYFHDGGARTLAEAVNTMARVQLGRKLSNDETRLIVGFLHTLTGEYRGRPLGNGLKKGP